jgi:lipopolysaccharide transport system ATP-binding protein
MNPSSAPIVIRIADLGKEYMIGAPSSGATSLRETLGDLLIAPLRRLSRLSRLSGHGSAREQFWALRKVDLAVNAGEVVGIIGRNGAGKSTVLKVLSRITSPTTGRVEITGRVASLLEVGTGFHSELTGRENIFLNGAILGMTRNDIRARFDAIVAFASLRPSSIHR